MPFRRRGFPCARRPEVRRETVTRSEKETEEAGERLARELDPRSVVYLVGLLGAGKTALARGLARGLGASSREVASPTFAIVNEYAADSGGIVLRHLDLYRLKDEETDLEILGLPGSVEGAPVAVEWPNATIRRLLPPTAEIHIEILPDGTRRLALSSQLSAVRHAKALDADR
jgi:tRNA threonylcarbamoyladenosine biosynthesis protein TsaE